MSALFIQEIVTGHSKWAKQVIPNKGNKIFHIYILILNFTSDYEPISNGFEHFILITRPKNPFPDTLQPLPCRLTLN